MKSLLPCLLFGLISLGLSTGFDSCAARAEPAPAMTPPAAPSVADLQQQIKTLQLALQACRQQRDQLASEKSDAELNLALVQNQLQELQKATAVSGPPKRP